MQSRYCRLIACFATALIFIPTQVNAQIVSKPGIIGVTVLEQTGDVHPWNFLLNPFLDSRLYIRQAEPFMLDFTDIATDAAEYYDVFLSNSRGKLDVNGNYIGIHYVTRLIRSGFAVGGNIDAIGLVFEDGSIRWATSIVKVVTGKGIQNISALATNGFAAEALGAPDGSVTFIGDFEGQLVVGFD